MTTQVKKPIALFPDLPRQTPLVDKNGHMHELWQQFFDQLIVQLQTNFRPEGFAIPQQTAANIALLVANTNSIPPYNPTSSIIYDSTNNLFKGNISGTWKTFTLT